MAPRLVKIVAHHDVWGVQHATAREGALSPAELARTFNCGIGMVAIVSPDRRDEALGLISDVGAREIGVVAKANGDDRVEIANVESAWLS